MSASKIMTNPADAVPSIAVAPSTAVAATAAACCATSKIKKQFVNTVNDDAVYSFHEMDKILTNIYQEISQSNKISEYNKKENLNKIIKIQSILLRNYENKKNIYVCFRKEIIKDRFKKEIKGYHMMNEQYITGTVWEEINKNIVKKHCTTSNRAYGNHISGKDNQFNDWNISNKSNNIEKNNMTALSSYRLTKVCASHDENLIKKEIEKRDSSFEYYSILLKKEKDKNIINYRWYIVPKEFHIFNVSKYPMEPKISNTKNSNGNIVGWKSKYWEILFSMSSQLWFRFNVDEIERFLITEVDVDMSTSASFTYNDIYEIVRKNQEETK